MSDLLSGRAIAMATASGVLWWPVATHNPMTGAILAGAAAVAVLAARDHLGRGHRPRPGGPDGPGRGGIGRRPPWQPAGPQHPDGSDGPEGPGRAPARWVDLESVPAQQRPGVDDVPAEDDLFAEWEREFAQGQPATGDRPASDPAEGGAGTGSTGGAGC